MGSPLEYALDTVYVTPPMVSEVRVMMISIGELEIHPVASPVTVPIDAPMEEEEEESEGSSTEDWLMLPLHQEEVPILE